MPDIWDTQEMMMLMDFLFLNFAIRVMVCISQFWWTICCFCADCCSWMWKRSSYSGLKPESNDEQENNQKICGLKNAAVAKGKPPHMKAFKWYVLLCNSFTNSWYLIQDNVRTKHLCNGYLELWNPCRPLLCICLNRILCCFCWGLEFNLLCSWTRWNWRREIWTQHFSFKSLLRRSRKSMEPLVSVISYYHFDSLRGLEPVVSKPLWLMFSKQQYQQFKHTSRSCTFSLLLDSSSWTRSEEAQKRKAKQNNIC